MIDAGPGRSISIHALREEGDPAVYNAMLTTSQFLSTPSARRATRFRVCLLPQFRISIHALREEGDPLCADCESLEQDFYPRPPRGGRRGLQGQHGRPRRFLSTPSARRATRCHRCPAHGWQISIHALREEGDDVGWL